MSTVQIPGGKAVAGCAACEEVFTCTSAFDKHQTLENGRSVCHDPSERGLVLYEKTSGGEVWSMWGWPATDGEGSWYGSSP